MRKLITIIIFFSFFIQSFSQEIAPKKLALIFAIGDYPLSGGWPKISSLRDAAYIKSALLDQGFQADNIRIVSDQNATVTGIKEAFEELIGRLKSGDIVVVHFSSHGERVEADNNDKVDGLDECVVTYNAKSPAKSTSFQKDQAEYLRGHTIGSYLLRIRAKLGRSGDVVVFMDDCYSGDGTRGASVIRGGQDPFVSSTFDPKKHRKSDSSLLNKEEIFSKADENEIASYEVISATRPDESDYEAFDETTNKPVGSLSFAISKALENMRSGSQLPTYRAFFASIQSVMNVKVPNQHPLLEGNGSDRIIFGGQFKYQMPYIEISSTDRPHNEVTVKQGKMAGLDTGAEIALFPSGTLDTSKATLLAKAKIIRSDNFLSTGLLDRDLLISTPSDFWVFVTERNYNIAPINIGFVSGSSADRSYAFSSANVERIKKNLANLPYIRFDGNPEILVVRGKSGDSIKINANGYLFSTINDAIDDTTVLKEKLEAYARYKFLQNLHCQVKNVSVEVQLVPLVNGKPDTAAAKNKMVNNTFVANDMDTLTLKIKNTGEKDAYVNILDMQPDGVINPVLPNSNLSFPIYAHDLKILAGQEYYLPNRDYIIVSPPYGTEVFKIFASEKEINLENIATSKGGKSAGLMTTMEKLITGSYNISRGATTQRIVSADASTSELIFLIRKK
jgi:metacaspase-1